MNTIEHFIIEIHGVQEVGKVVEDSQSDYVKVDLTTDSCGHIGRQTHIWTAEEWEKIRKEGKFLA